MITTVIVSIILGMLFIIALKHLLRSAMSGKCVGCGDCTCSSCHCCGNLKEIEAAIINTSNKS